MAEQFDYELGWDDEIENDSPQFTLLPDGDYAFEVTDFERARHNGSEKLPACNKAVVYIRIEGKDANGKAGVAIIRHQIFLHSKMQGMLCAFFVGIGQGQHGEKLKMNWDAVIGSRGKAKVGSRKYEGETYNEIKRFYEPESPQVPGFYQVGKF